MTHTHRPWSRALVTLALVSFGVAGELAAQSTTTAGISGVVRSAEGTPISAADVVARNEGTGITSRATTRADGRFFVPHLNVAGTYSVQVSALGYRTERQEDISLTLGQVFNIEFTLRPEALAVGDIEVTVTRADAFSRSRMGTETTVSERTINDMPTLDRHINDLAAISPYVSLTGNAPSVAGQNNRMNNIQIDGAVNNDVFGLASSGVPGGQANAKPISIDAIEQFEILVAPFDVRHAGFSGGLINAVTKSGTNQWRGSLYGFYRDESLLNSELPFTIPTAGPFSVGDTLRTEDFLDRTVGFSLGGPIVQNQLHLFAAGEMQQRRFPQEFGINSSPIALRQHPDSIQRFMDILENQYGLNPGDPSAYALENPNANLFARLDWRPNTRHRVTLRHNFVRASDDDSPSRGGSNFELSSATYDFNSTTNSTVLQLHSSLSARDFNELLVNVQTIRDRRDPVGRYSLIRTRNSSFAGLDDEGNDVIVNGTLGAGAEFFSQANELDQNIVQITDNFTRLFGSHRATVGGQYEFYRFRNVFAPGTLGEWTFNSLEDLEQGNATSFFINTIYPGVDDVAARFSVHNFSLYGQDEWTVNNNLTVVGGLRLDVPFLPDSPRENPDFAAAFDGRSTASVPSGNVQLSPRLGFNWQTGDELLTQIRGGAGLFTGRPPFVWLSNQYGNTGRELIGLNCTGANVPAFDPLDPPTTCADGTPATAGGVAIVNVFDDGFRFPQDLKISLALDQQLPWELRGSIEGLYTRAINQIALRDLNIIETTSPQSEPGIGDRPIYGTPIDASFEAMAPNRVDASFGPVIELTNLSKNYSYLLNFELERQFGDALDLRAAYTHSRAYDTRSLTSSIATSNFGFAPIRGNPNDPELSPSSFDRPHKVLIAGTASLFEDYGGTRLTLFYVGRSGRPYSYVYDGDVNGDGYETFGVVNNRNNDLVYVPNDVSEITWSPTGRPVAEDARLLTELIDLEPCLQEQRGQIMERNSCRAPWVNSLNVKLEQGLPLPTQGGRLLFTMDVFNLLNLLNEGWGLEQAPLFSEVNLLQLRGRQGTDPSNPMQFDYFAFTRSDPNTGTEHAIKPFTTFFSSRWALQAGLRLTF